MEIVRLSPQDPLPEQRGAVIVLRQFAEDDPQARLVSIEVAGETARTVIAGDDDAALEDGVTQARDVAQARGLERVFVIDRTASRIAHEAVTHHGDRTTLMDECATRTPKMGSAARTCATASQADRRTGARPRPSAP